MITALQAATFISQHYLKKKGVPIDEMKLHKLLYFAQRESIILFNEPLFSDKFVAWKYGPVMLCVRDALKIGPLNEPMSIAGKAASSPVFDSVFQRYADRPSWSLSTLTHGEFSWQNARKGLSPEVNGNRLISNDDIRIDAERIKFRRALFE